MGARFNIGLTIGVLAVMLLTTSVIIYFTKATRTNQEIAKQQSEQNSKDIAQINKTVNDFIDKWVKRIQVSNKVNNATQQKIEDETKNILGNLTAHRYVSNYTRDITLNLLNRSLTTEQSTILADQAVKNIVGNVTQYINKTLLKDEK